MSRLTGAERHALQQVFAGWSTMPGELVVTVERILTQREAAWAAKEES